MSGQDELYSLSSGYALRENTKKSGRVFGDYFKLGSDFLKKLYFVNLLAILPTEEWDIFVSSELKSLWLCQHAMLKSTV